MAYTTWSMYRSQRRRGLAVLLAAAAATIGLVALGAVFLWPQTALGRPGPVTAGWVNDIPIDQPQFFTEGKFWLVRRGKDDFLALSAVDPYEGCTVPWRPTFTWYNAQGVGGQGWFRDPCFADTYTLDGICVYGPCPRGLDRYPVEISRSRVFVHTELPPIQGPPRDPNWQPPTWLNPSD